MHPCLALFVLTTCLLTGCGRTDSPIDDVPADSGADAILLPADDPVGADAGFDGGEQPEKDAGAATDASGSSTDSEGPIDSESPIDSERPNDSGTMTDAGTPDTPATADAADLSARFDIVYIDEFTTAWNRTGLLGFLAIVNTGTRPLDLAKLSIVTYVDDSPDFDSTFEHVVTSTNLLPPNHVAGAVSRDGIAFLLERGFLTEPFINDDTLFGITFHEHANPGTDLHALLTLRIDDAEVVLPFTIHFVLEQVTRADHASRIRSR